MNARRIAGRACGFAVRLLVAAVVGAAFLVVIVIAAPYLVVRGAMRAAAHAPRDGGV